MSALKNGSCGPEVVKLQQALNAKGFNLECDGEFGDNTEKAVIAFQKSQNLTPDGKAGKDTFTALGLTFAPTAFDIHTVTAAQVANMFPGAPQTNIQTYLPIVLSALSKAGLADKDMVLMALATIRAETAGFKPISEGISKYNTSPGAHPFDKYDNRSDLGNHGKPDGERYKGRGFIQLTGRANYQQHGTLIGLGNQLVDNPDLANDAHIAAQLLASFLKAKEHIIRGHLAAHDLAKARRDVNGGSHGLDAFEEAFHTGQNIL